MHPVLRQWWPAVLLVATPVLLSAETAARLTYDQMERFLQTANIVKIKELGTGVTRSRRATFSDGASTTHTCRTSAKPRQPFRQIGHGAEFSRHLEIQRRRVPPRPDSRLDMIPPSIERKVNGTASAVTWWLNDCMMEATHQEKGRRPTKTFGTADARSPRVRPAHLPPTATFRTYWSTRLASG
jgi:hypothetical protein